MRNATMIVLVFMTNCQVSLNPNIRPVAAQTKMMSTATAKIAGCPAAREVNSAKWVNRESLYTMHPFISILTRRQDTTEKHTLRGRARDCPLTLSVLVR